MVTDFYVILGNSTLREIFMKTDNFIHGKYFAHLIKVWLHLNKHQSDMCYSCIVIGGDG